MAYVCGHSERELHRLELQAQLYEDITRSFLKNAGISRGMHVLDLGCGAGDVTLLLQQLVGRTGRVTALDRAAEAIALARERARGAANVQFHVADIRTFNPTSDFNAIVGRFVLMHQDDPAATLRHAARYLQHEGLLAILESHISTAELLSYPRSETYDRITRWMVEVIRTAGSHPDMGLRLRQVFLDAGLPAPQISIAAHADGGREATIYPYIAESVRSLATSAAASGHPLGLDPDAIADLLSEEVAEASGLLISPLLVGAWCRVPHGSKSN